MKESIKKYKTVLAVVAIVVELNCFGYLKETPLENRVLSTTQDNNTSCIIS